MKKRRMKTKMLALRMEKVPILRMEWTCLFQVHLLLIPAAVQSTLTAKPALHSILQNSARFRSYNVFTYHVSKESQTRYANV